MSRISPSGRRARRLLAGSALCVALLAGCATTRVSPDAPLPAETGLLVVRVVSNADGVMDWDALEVWSTDQKRTLLLYAIDPISTGGYRNAKTEMTEGVESTSVFVGTLPAGGYRLEAVKRTRAIGSWVTTTTAPVPQVLGTFRVRPGEATNLGTLVYQYHLNSAIASKYLVTRLTAPAEFSAFLRRRFPAIASHVLQKPVSTWDSTSDESARQAVVRLAQAGSAQVNDPRETPWGELVAGSRLGQVLVRAADGRWRSVDTGYTSEIFTVLPLKNGQLLASGEEGMLLVSDDRGLHWAPAPTPASGVIEDVAQAEDGQCYVVVRGPAEYAVYRTDDPKARPWQEVHRFERGRRPGRLTMFARPRLLAAMPHGEFVAYDAGAQQWRSVTSSSSLKLARVRMREDGLLYAVAEGANAYERRVVASRDWGRSWDVLGTWSTGKVEDVLFTSASAGYLVLNKRAAGGGVLLVTADGGKSWSERGALPMWAESVFLADAGRVLLVSKKSGFVAASRDQGKSWTVERRVGISLQ